MFPTARQRASMVLAPIRLRWALSLAKAIADLRSGLAAAARSDAPKEVFETAMQGLEAKQLALGQVSRDYKDHLRVRTANLDDVRARCRQKRC